MMGEWKLEVLDPYLYEKENLRMVEIQELEKVFLFQKKKAPIFKSGKGLRDRLNYKA